MWDRAETATGDCTVAACGDGVLNKAAGEACDTQNLAEACDGGGVDTATCNADCTSAFCGDGHVNAAAGEECDDGNADDTDHCSTTFKRQ